MSIDSYCIAEFTLYVDNKKNYADDGESIELVINFIINLLGNHKNMEVLPFISKEETGCMIISYCSELVNKDEYVNDRKLQLNCQNNKRIDIEIQDVDYESFIKFKGTWIELLKKHV
jgi:hypothetical protein